MSGGGDGACLGDRLLYSQCWEDVECARAALRIQPGQTVLAVGAAGDNALALLLDDPGRVLAIDVNPAQTALAELKAAAIQRLPLAAVAPFVGAGPGPDRLARYETIRPALSPNARTWWDAAPDAVASGVIHQGRLERYLALFRRHVLSLVPGRATLRAMLAATSLAEQRSIYATRWNSPLWRGLFRLFFSKWALAARGRHPAFFTHCAVDDLGRHYLARCRAGLTDVPIQDNSFVTYMLLGAYDHPGRLPVYLRPDALARLRPRAARLTIETAGLMDTLSSLPDRSIDAFYLSDVFELFSQAEHEVALVELARVGRPGARLCYWNNLVERRRPAHLAQLLASHDDTARALHRHDRAFLYSRFVVESVEGA